MDVDDSEMSNTSELVADTEKFNIGQFQRNPNHGQGREAEGEEYAV